MPDLPTDLTYGKVTGRFLTAVGDGPDAGTLPDAAVPTGLTVKFTPKTATFKTTSPSVTVVSRPITCTIDSEGNLLDPRNEVGVWLIVGLYSVTYSGGSDFVLPSHEVEVTTSHTALAPLDLTVAMPPGPVLTPTQYTELNGRVTVLENSPGGGGEGGVTDHGLLTGLSDDDHPQYMNSARGDARYVVVVEHGTVASTARPSGAAVVLWVGSVEPSNAEAGDQWDDAAASPANYVETDDPRLTDARTPTAHTHPIADLTATGTKDATTFLRGDGTWAVPAGGGGGLDTEGVQDVVGSMVVGAGGTYNDTAGSITLPSGGGSDPWTYVISSVDTANATTSAVNITGLSVPALANGLYVVEAMVAATSGATTEGARVGVANNATGATLVMAGSGANSATATAGVWPGSAQYPSVIATTGAPTSSSTFVAAWWSGTLRAASMSGTVNMTVTSETGGGVIAKADSYIRYRKIAD